MILSIHNWFPGHADIHLKHIDEFKQLARCVLTTLYTNHIQFVVHH